MPLRDVPRQWSCLRLEWRLILYLSLLFLCDRQALAKKTHPQPLNITCNESLPDSVPYGRTNFYHIERMTMNNSSSSSIGCTVYAWSVAVGYPTLYISHLQEPCKCTQAVKNESEFLTNQSYGSISLPGNDSNFELAIVFTRLFEYKVNKSSLMFNITKACSSEDSKDKDFRFVDLSEGFEWNTTSDGNGFVATHNEHVKNDSRLLLYIRPTFPSLTDLNRLKQFPRPLLSENGTVVDLTIVNFTYALSNDSKPASRLALEMFVVHGNNVKSGNVTNHQYLDDEYTPSIFSQTTYNVSGKVTEKLEDDMGGYIQWKPISYQSRGRKSTESQQVKLLQPTISDLEKGCTLKDNMYLRGLVSAQFGEDAYNMTISRWFIAFGTSGDDTYLNSEYMTWTINVGYGTVPKDSLSFVVIITIIVGFGLPGLLVIVGAVYIFIRKKPWIVFTRKWRSYPPLN